MTDNAISNQQNSGVVYLVGAGPGDPGLITVRGLERVRQADVIIHDRLIPLELLNEARPDAEIIDAGKAAGDHKLKQHEINALLVERAGRGMAVVRLKGGDPFVFGRGGEEALACHAAGVRFEVVPGVSSAIAVPAYAGVPVTHRELASAFTVFTGHDAPDHADNSVDYEAVAAAARLGTVVFVMGATFLPQIVARLLEVGVPGDTPAMCVEWGTTARQRQVVGTLADLPTLAAEAGIGSPALTVIGNVVSLRAQGLDWFRPTVS